MDPRVWCRSPETPSNTTRAVLALVGLGVPKDDPRVRRALAWLLGQQKPDGSWFDFWITGKAYGTVMALEALVGLGARAPGDPEVERAVNLFLRTQNADGGWGFDWYGRRVNRSAVEHTALAVYALCRFCRERSHPMGALEAGVRFLLARQADDGNWPGSYVCNYSGWEGYASSHYARVFTLRALAAYRVTLGRYLPTAPQLVRANRLAQRKAARGG